MTFCVDLKHICGGISLILFCNPILFCEFDAMIIWVQFDVTDWQINQLKTWMQTRFYSHHLNYAHTIYTRMRQKSHLSIFGGAFPFSWDNVSESRPWHNTVDMWRQIICLYQMGSPRAESQVERVIPLRNGHGIFTSWSTNKSKMYVNTL